MLPVSVLVFAIFFAVSTNGDDLCYISDDGKPNYCNEGVCTGSSCLGIGELVGFGLGGLAVLVLFGFLMRCLCVRCKACQEKDEDQERPKTQKRRPSRVTPARSTSPYPMDDPAPLPRYYQQPQSQPQSQPQYYPQPPPQPIVPLQRQQPQPQQPLSLPPQRQQPPSLPQQRQQPPSLPPQRQQPQPYPSHPPPTSYSGPPRSGWGVVRGGEPL